MCRYACIHATCGRCGSTISTWDDSRGRVCACEKCQPLVSESHSITSTRAQALRAVRPPKLLSICHSLLCSARPRAARLSAFAHHKET